VTRNGCSARPSPNHRRNGQATVNIDAVAERAKAKTLPTTASVGEFIAQVENATRRSDATSLLTLFEGATGAVPVMWGTAIIGFGQYAFEYESGHSGIMCAVGFSPRKANSTLYLAPSILQDSARLKKLGPHRTSTACLYIANLKNVEIDVLHAMIEDSFQLKNQQTIVP
jgi:hypothetical protein